MNINICFISKYETKTKKTAPLKAKIESFIATFKKEEIKEGDVFVLNYIPGVGVKTSKNNTATAASLPPTRKILVAPGFPEPCVLGSG